MVAPRRVTIHDVAREAGVSIATVSRVINGGKTVNPLMAEKVKEAASRIGYRPNDAARGLVSGTFRTVGVVTPDLANQYFPELLRAVVSAAKADAYRVVVIDSLGDPEEEYEACRQQVPNVDGLILLSPRMSDEHLASLTESAKPVVLVNRVVDSLGVPMITADNRSAIRELCRHLYSLGHRTIVHLTSDVVTWQATERVTAMQEAARQLGFELTIMRSDQGIAGGYGAADGILRHRPTAVVAFNDLMAFGVISRLSELELQVPGDISVTGFDDIDVARYSSPALTTALSPKERLGRQGWEAMRAALTGEKKSTGTPVPVSVIVRSSTGPA